MIKKLTDKQWQVYLEKIKDFPRRYAASEEQEKFMCEIILSLPKGSVALELGTCWGITSALLALASAEKSIDFTTVDNFKMEQNRDITVPQLNSLGVPITIIESDTQSAPWDKQLDFLFIDAGHDEANAKPDMEKYIPFVKSGGYVAFHDWDGAEDPNVSPHFAVTKYGNIWTGDWKEIAYIGDQLMIRQKP